ncbi:MAG: ORF6N domain-containing protein [Nitrospinae bacterium]|nr:ORF6N domain-containing protein [Nitrospinota bacterium]
MMLAGIDTFCRNVDRFPSDFMFQLTREEAESLRFQIGMSKCLQHIKTLRGNWKRWRKNMTHSSRLSSIQSANS